MCGAFGALRGRRTPAYQVHLLLDLLVVGHRHPVSSAYLGVLVSLFFSISFAIRKQLQMNPTELSFNMTMLYSSLHVSCFAKPLSLFAGRTCVHPCLHMTGLRVTYVVDVGGLSS